MYIAILQDGEVENEINVDLCCNNCSRTRYNWSTAQFNFVRDFADKEKPFPVPAEVDDLASFAKYILTLNP